MIRGLINFIRDGWLINFDERLYIATYIKPCASPWANIWSKCPRLHFCLKCTDDAEAQRAILGCTLDELRQSASRIDANKPVAVVLTHDVTRAGAPRIALEITRHLRKSYNVVFLSLCGGDLQGECAVAASCSFFNIGFHDITRKITQLLKRLCLPAKPAFVIANSIGSADALEGLSATGAPVIQLVHEIADIESPRRFAEVALRCDAVVFPAGLVRDRALANCPSLKRERTCVIPQGVFSSEDSDGGDSKRLKQIFGSAGIEPEETVVVLGVGSVQFLKGVDLFVLCAQTVFGKCPEANIRFVWAGAGYDENDSGYSAYLRRQIECAGLSGKVVFAGKIRNIHDIYRKADLFFLSSRFDSLPIAAQDAMAAGIPVICFDGAGGIPEYLHQDSDAVFGVVPYLDIPAASDKILRLAGNKTLRTKVGKGNLHVAERYFCKEGYFQALDEVCAKVMSGGATVYSEKLSTLF